ncbi:hypothetical protein AAZV13_20G202400 [Glycine max]
MWFLVGTWPSCSILLGLSGKRLLMIGLIGTNGLASEAVLVYYLKKVGSPGGRRNKSISNIQECAESLLRYCCLYYQYGLVYHLKFTKRTKSFLVYGISWLVIFLILFVMKTVSVGRRKFSADFQLVFRLIKGLIFLTFISILVTMIALPHMTIQDIIVCILAFMLTGWGMLQNFRPVCCSTKHSVEVCKFPVFLEVKGRGALLAIRNNLSTFP